MPFISWDDCYSIKIPKTDEEHKNLINILNQLDEAIHKNHSHEIIGNIIEQLIEYTRTHFSSEEKLMKEVDYPDLEKHRRKHIGLTEDAEEFQNKLQTNQDFSIEKLMEFLWNWLLDHIMNEDKKFGQYYIENRQKVGQSL